MDYLRDETINLARLLISRLERLSADSIWSHRASGLRGELLRWLEQIEEDTYPGETGAARRLSDLNRLNGLLETGFEYLESAAQELIA
jgi:hypothetical protein